MSVAQAATLRAMRSLLGHLTHEKQPTPEPGTPEDDALWASVRLATRDGWARPGPELLRLKAMVEAACCEPDPNVEVG